MKQRIAAIAAVALLLLLGLFLARRDTKPAAAPAPQKVQVAQPAAPRAHPVATATERAPPVAPDPALPEPITAATALAWPGQRGVQCAAGPVAEGLLLGRATHRNEGGEVLFAHNEGGWLTAVVTASTGEAMLYEHLQVAGRLAWSGAGEEGGGQCTVHPLRLFPLHGVILHADGTPAEGVEVRGCRHGEIVLSDAAGRFSLQIAEGATCDPMAFLDTEAAFYRSSVVTVHADGLPLDDIELTFPAKGWTPEEQLALMGQMRKMLAANLNRRTRENPAADAASQAEAPETAGRLRQWGDAVQGYHDTMHDDLQRLTDEEPSETAFRDLWLDQY